MFLSPIGPTWWVLLLLLIVFILVGPSMGLLFYSYGNHLEEAEANGQTTFIKTQSYGKHQNPIESKEKEKRLLTIKLLASGKYSESNLENLENLSSDQLASLIKEAYPNESDEPISIDIVDVSIKGNMLVLGTSYYNIECTAIGNLELNSSFLSFVLSNKKYIVKYDILVDAQELYSQLKKYLK